MALKGDCGFFVYRAYWTGLLGLNPRTAFALRRSGKGPLSSQAPHYTDGNHRYHRYRKKDLAEWLSDCRHDTTESKPRQVTADMIDEDWVHCLPIFSPAAAALRLGVSERTLRRWRKDNRGPAYFMIGESPRYAGIDLAQFKKPTTGKSSSD